MLHRNSYTLNYAFGNFFNVERSVTSPSTRQLICFATTACSELCFCFSHRDARIETPRIETPHRVRLYQLLFTIH